MTAWFDARVVGFCKRFGVPSLRLSLGLVYLWFGGLKLAAVSPVEYLVSNLYPFLPEPQFVIFLGVWEIVIGALLMLNRAVRTATVLLWLQMAGIMIGPVVKYALFFQSGNPLLLNMEGEFIVKNLVLIAASLVVAAHLKPNGRAAADS